MPLHLTSTTAHWFLGAYAHYLFAGCFFRLIFSFFVFIPSKASERVCMFTVAVRYVYFILPVFLYNVLKYHSKTGSMPIWYFSFLKKLYTYILLLSAKSFLLVLLFFHIRKYSALSLIINWLVFFDDFYLYAHFNVKINACHILLVFFRFNSKVV